MSKRSVCFYILKNEWDADEYKIIQLDTFKTVNNNYVLSCQIYHIPEGTAFAIM